MQQATDEFLEIPSVDANPNSMENESKRGDSLSPRLPAEKEIIASNSQSQSQAALPYNFNQFLQYV